jgi:hypothetical protein
MQYKAERSSQSGSIVHLSLSTRPRQFVTLVVLGIFFAFFGRLLISFGRLLVGLILGVSRVVRELLPDGLEESFALMRVG